MKIFIQKSGKETFQFSLPFGTIPSWLTASFISSSLKSRDVTVTRRQTAALIKALNRFCRQYPGWTLCEVKRPDGGCVKIIL